MQNHFPRHHPLGPGCPSTRLSTSQAKQAGWACVQYNSALDNHSIGRHAGRTCPHRIIFDCEVSTPGTELHKEAQARGGICADELWLIISSIRRCLSFQDGNDGGHGIRLPIRWDYVMDRILNAAPWEESCGPYGLLPEGAEFRGSGGGRGVVEAGRRNGMWRGLGWERWEGFAQGRYGMVMGG
ncbi:MAG: hypothetical protein LQ349_007673 [Xanthoria aureola]|nr:MAG: hypothetical protein LQ349_007673 [Xanthoria aureola]